VRNTDPDGERPSWMGAPGYQPHRELPPHAPMPGAPPYPAGEEHPPPPVGQAARTTPLALVLAACAVAAALNVLLVLIFGPVTPVTAALIPVVVAAVTALGLWSVVRHRRMPFTLLLVVAVPAYFVLRALATLLPV
jgi:hypothetical protein